ncbi:bifunctional molybdenum cofactor biosynthesis protein MoaC/MoaB [candidate division KSB1 bacterium]|nr:bifunctional molybdenum cofactor biosynthesis protein MoaC/MoaB [candidate division KSB1 bacterium]
MIDVSPKFNTLRYAKASGVLSAGKETILRVKEKTVPKGDVLATARSAGIQAAKKTSDWIVFCHPIPIDWADISFEIKSNQIQVIAEVKTIWKTGVEMEALSAVSAALLNIYDMLKPLDESLFLGDIKLLQKQGGKSDFIDQFEAPLKAAVLVISDSTFSGKREDKSGKLIQKFLCNQPISVDDYQILPDEIGQIREKLIDLVDNRKIDLIFTTGGTGLSPRDVTPEATKDIIHKSIPGIAETIRRHGKERTPYAMLSREICGVRNQSMIINLPGSTKGVKESLQAIFPGILHAFPIIHGDGH